jgi:hypothetical protein
MSKEELMSITHETYKPTICIDVDGVIADYSQGFKGPKVIGAPLPGAREFLERLREAGWKIVIFTTRGNDVMEQYMEQHSLYYDEINDNSSLRGENPGKPIAAVYLDDRGIRFNGDFDQAFEQIMNFKVWYEEPRRQFSFSRALKKLKAGKRLARRGWYGKGLFVVYQKGYPNGIPCNKQTAEAWGMNEGDLFKCNPYLQIKQADGSHSMWVPSIGDVLAEDWEVVE